MTESAPEHGAPTEDPTDRLDELLEVCLEAFLPHAPLTEVERLRDFLPAEDPSLQAFLLGELIKLDMAAAAEAGVAPSLDRYVSALPDLLSAERLPFDLVIEEYQLCREAGEEPKQADYAERFPQHAELLLRFSCNAETMAAAGRPAAPRELADGDQIDDFAVIRELGSGAFARVYLARQISMQRLVALKVSAGTGDEPQALAQFDHPNIVRVYDQRSLDAGATHLLYMQYQPGGTLSDVVKRARWSGAETRSGQLVLDAIDDNLLDAAQQSPEGSAIRGWITEASWPMTIAWLGGQLARALEDAHQRGVLHRDVKPANVLMSAEGVPKLADFNVSLAGGAGRAGAAATLGGSIGYMAPEHLAAIGGLPGTEPEDVAERADLYSLAVLLWELWQGRRPFEVDRKAESWTDALAGQIVSRDQALVEPERRANDSSERVLEGVLREALASDPADRPASGGEFAGRLQLALHPEAASLFDPPEGTWRRWALGAPTILMIAAAVLLPNILAGFFNYFYNEREVIQPHSPGGELLLIEGLKSFFVRLSTIVNVTFFPLGGAIAAYYGVPVARAINRAKAGEEVAGEDIDGVFTLCHRGALLGGTLWGVASVVFPVALSWRFAPDFGLGEAAHFCLSLLICGGVAAVYPYFLLMTTVASVYYPQLVRSSMTDEAFDRRGESLRRHGELYLFAAAIIPLMAIVLLVSRDDIEGSKDMILCGVLATVLGLFAAFNAYRYVLKTWDRMKPVLTTERSAVGMSAWDSVG